MNLIDEILKCSYPKRYLIPDSASSTGDHVDYIIGFKTAEQGIAAVQAAHGLVEMVGVTLV